MGRQGEDWIRSEDTQRAAFWDTVNDVFVTWADYMLFGVPEGFCVDYGIRTEGNGPTVSSRIPCSVSLYHTAAETTLAKLH